MPKRDFLALSDLSRDEIVAVLDLASRMKSGRYVGQPLAGKSLGMIFGKSSTRTRVSFEVGAYQLGGHAVFLSTRDIQLGRGEPARDIARVLSSYIHGIMVRTESHSELEELARYATIPVINGQTDLLHPCQLLADLLTVRECLGGWEGKCVAWIGDGNNMANSWIEAAGIFGFELRIAAPEGYEPDHEIFNRAKSLTSLLITEDPEEAASGAHAVSTDVWAPADGSVPEGARLQAFQGYRVDDTVLAQADAGAIFLHPLPAHRGEEVTESVLEGPQSRVWQQAANRLHVEKALMATLMGDGR